jgi:glycosyltransferase involved in cell wall biosynthesis
VTTVDRPVRVLWLIKGLGPGGAERLLVEHARAGDHEHLHYEVAYLLDWKQHLVPELEGLGVQTHCLGVSRELDPRWVTRLRQLLQHGHFDVVHAHSPVLASVARVLIRTLPRDGRPTFVYTEHNRWPSYKVVTRLANHLTYALNDATVAVSGDVRDSVSPRFRTDVEVVVHGVDVAAVRSHITERESVRHELGVQTGETLAVTVANLRHGKNYPGLLAAAQLVVERGLPVRFAAAGQGPLAAEISALHAASGLGDRFALLGYRDDATRLIAGADLFVLASHHEGLPVTVMEALTLGVPVVAPEVGGLREVVHSGENGILVEPGSPAALADAIARAATPAVHARLAQGARATGKQFASTHAVARIDALYRHLRG